MGGAELARAWRGVVSHRRPVTFLFLELPITSVTTLPSERALRVTHKSEHGGVSHDTIHYN